MNERTCPSCEVDLLPIHVWSRGGHMHGPGFNYSVDNPEPGWLGRLGLKNKDGTIQGHLCPECDQVFFFAQPA